MCADILRHLIPEVFIRRIGETCRIRQRLERSQHDSQYQESQQICRYLSRFFHGCFLHRSGMTGFIISDSLREHNHFHGMTIPACLPEKEVIE